MKTLETRIEILERQQPDRAEERISPGMPPEEAASIYQRIIKAGRPTRAIDIRITAEEADRFYREFIKHVRNAKR